MNDLARRPTPAGRTSTGGGSTAPAGRHGLVARGVATLRESTWAPVVGRTLAIAAGMLVLAAIGAASTLSGGGVAVASAAASPSAEPVASAPHAASSGAASNTTPAQQAPTQPASGPASPGVTADGKIALNQATADELMKLPRVGPKRAQAILELRHRLGRFHQPTDLLRVKGIGRKTLRLMLPLVVVDAESDTKKTAAP